MKGGEKVPELEELYSGIKDKLYYYIEHPEEAPRNVRPDIYKLISDLNKMPSDAQKELLAEMIKDDPSNDKIEKLRKRRL